jgi:hypothetical protein
VKEYKRICRTVEGKNPGGYTTLDVVGQPLSGGILVSFQTNKSRIGVATCGAPNSVPNYEITFCAPEFSAEVRQDITLNVAEIRRSISR